MNILYPSPIQDAFASLSSLLKEELFLVGGSIRDLSLGRKVDDLDFATAKDPVEVHALFPDAHYFAKYGTTSFSYHGFHVTIATFRKEEDYLDHRHPTSVCFIKDYRIDCLRRDFTVNALYGKQDGEILDPTAKGLDDLSSHVLRMIGDPVLRLKEDPLRIVRAYRFQEELSFSFDKELESALKKQESLLTLLNPEKIKEEIRKFPPRVQKKYAMRLLVTDMV